MTNSRLKKIMILNIGLLIFGIIYFIFVINELGFECFIYKTFKIKCPGCGLSHLFVELFKFNFSESFKSNPFLFCTLPILFMMYLISNYLYYKNGSVNNKFNLITYSVYLSLLIFWMIIRNII